MISFRTPGLLLAAALLCALTPAAVAGDNSSPESPRTVLLDPGHDYKSTGAYSSSNVPEYRFNLRIADELKAKLESRGYRVMVTHGADELSSLADRTRFTSYDIFVSLHHDSIDEEYCLHGIKPCTTYSAYGYSLWVSPENPQYSKSYRLADLIGTRLTEDHFIHSVHHVMVTRREVLDRAKGIFSFPHCYVLRHNKKPAILIEVAVITNPLDEQNAESADFRNRFLENVAGGIDDYFQDTSGAVQPPPQPEAANNRTGARSGKVQTRSRGTASGRTAARGKKGSRQHRNGKRG